MCRSSTSIAWNIGTKRPTSPSEFQITFSTSHQIGLRAAASSCMSIIPACAYTVAFNIRSCCCYTGLTASLLRPEEGVVYICIGPSAAGSALVRDIRQSAPSTSPLLILHCCTSPSTYTTIYCAARQRADSDSCLLLLLLLLHRPHIVSAFGWTRHPAPLPHAHRQLKVRRSLPYHPPNQWSFATRYNAPATV